MAPDAETNTPDTEFGINMVLFIFNEWLENGTFNVSKLTRAWEKAICEQTSSASLAVNGKEDTYFGIVFAVTVWLRFELRVLFSRSGETGQDRSSLP